MMLLAQSEVAGNPAENHLATLMFVAVCAGLCWPILKWTWKIQKTPDPWGSEVSAALDENQATPLCPNCLTPHEEADHFCRECGGPVGPYTNLLPFPYLFSIGHMLRSGTSGSFRRSPVPVIGYFLVAIVEYAVFAPVYWVFLIKNMLQLRDRPRPAEASLEGDNGS